MAVEILLVALSDRIKNVRLPSIYHRAGARVTVLGNPRASLRWSRFVSRRVGCKASDLPGSLQSILRESPSSLPSVVFCDEESLGAIAQHRGQRWLDDVLPVDQYGLMLDAMVGRAALMDAISAALPTAPFYICHSAADVKTAAGLLGFPMRLLPDCKTAWHPPIQVCNPSHIDDACGREFNGPLVAMQPIAGKAGFTDILYHRGQAVGWSNWYAGAKPQPVFDQQLNVIVENLGQLTGFHGFCGIEWIEDADGEFSLTEFHPRPTEGISWARHNGVDFSLALREMFHGVLRVQKPKRMPPSGLCRWFPGLMYRNIPWSDPGVWASSALRMLNPVAK
jgi:hypothetical protein